MDKVLSRLRFVFQLVLVAGVICATVTGWARWTRVWLIVAAGIQIALIVMTAVRWSRAKGVDK